MSKKKKYYKNKKQNNKKNPKIDEAVNSQNLNSGTKESVMKGLKEETSEKDDQVLENGLQLYENDLTSIVKDVLE